MPRGNKAQGLIKPCIQTTFKKSWGALAEKRNMEDIAAGLKLSPAELVAACRQCSKIKVWCKQRGHDFPPPPLTTEVSRRTLLWLTYYLKQVKIQQRFPKQGHINDNRGQYPNLKDPRKGMWKVHPQ